MAESKRQTAYETSVVDHFYRLGYRHFERRQVVAMWERPMLTGQRGRPEAVDIALFDAQEATETRIEFGEYKRSKLRDDSRKLARLHRQAEPDYSTVISYLILWHEIVAKLTESRVKAWLNTVRTDAAQVTAGTLADIGAGVVPQLVSAVDLFSERAGQHRIALVGLFSVRMSDE